MVSVPRPTSPRTFKRAKLQKKKDKVKESQSLDKQQDVTVKTTIKLKTEDIEKALNEDEILSDDSEGAKPVEAKTLNVQQDKDLCLKRLNSSWTNLNESKKDFNTTTPLNSSQVKPESKPSGESAVTNRKKKISDYFQSVPKT